MKWNTFVFSISLNNTDIQICVSSAFLKAIETNNKYLMRNSNDQVIYVLGKFYNHIE